MATSVETHQRGRRGHTFIGSPGVHPSPRGARPPNRSGAGLYASTPWERSGGRLVDTLRGPIPAPSPIADRFFPSLDWPPFLE